MSTPITWRNVTGPSAAEAAPVFQAAQRTINGAFDAFGNMIKQREAADAANVGVQNEVAKQNFLDILSGAKTPEELAALQQSGVVDQARASLNAAGRAATRGADEARLTSLRQQTTAADTFNDAVLDREQRPIKDTVLGLATQGKSKEALAIIEANPGLRNAAELHKAILSGERDMTRFGWEGQRAGFAVNADRRAAGAEERAVATHGIAIQNSQLQLDAAKQAAADTEIGRALETRLSNFAANHQNTTGAMKQAIEGEAAAFGKELPRNNDGSLAVNRMTTAQKEALNVKLTAKGLPTVDTIEEGDTKAAANFIAGLKEAGFKPSAIAKVQSLVPAAIGTAPMAAIGNDAANSERKTRLEEAVEKEEAIRYGAIATPGTQDGLLKAGLEAVDANTEKGSWKREDFRREMAKFISDGGIKVGTGADAMRVLPSPETLSVLINRIDQSMFTRDSNEIRNSLEQWAKSPEAIAGAQKLIQTEASKRIRGVDKETAAKSGK